MFFNHTLRSGHPSSQLTQERDIDRRRLGWGSKPKSSKFLADLNLMRYFPVNPGQNGFQINGMVLVMERVETKM
jgi:hypothetical protein